MNTSQSTLFYSIYSARAELPHPALLPIATRVEESSHRAETDHLQDQEEDTLPTPRPSPRSFSPPEKEKIKWAASSIYSTTTNAAQVPTDMLHPAGAALYTELLPLVR